MLIKGHQFSGIIHHNIPPITNKICKVINEQHLKNSIILTFTPTFLAIESCDRDVAAENRVAVGANGEQCNQKIDTKKKRGTRKQLIMKQLSKK